MQKDEATVSHPRRVSASTISAAHPSARLIELTDDQGVWSLAQIGRPIVEPLFWLFIAIFLATAAAQSLTMSLWQHLSDQSVDQLIIWGLLVICLVIVLWGIASHFRGRLTLSPDEKTLAVARRYLCWNINRTFTRSHVARVDVSLFDDGESSDNFVHLTMTDGTRYAVTSRMAEDEAIFFANRLAEKLALADPKIVKNGQPVTRGGGSAM